MSSARRSIKLKGPGGRPVNVTFEKNWSKSQTYPCLYVGKTTGLRKRVSQHLLRTKECRLTSGCRSARVKPTAYNSSCQLRQGIEWLFPRNDLPVELIYDSVGLSTVTEFGDNPVAERFFLENKLIGDYEPWINIDTER